LPMYGTMAGPPNAVAPSFRNDKNRLPKDGLVCAALISAPCAGTGCVREAGLCLKTEIDFNKFFRQPEVPRLVLQEALPTVHRRSAVRWLSERHVASHWLPEPNESSAPRF